jgi:hypothetical protein
MKNSFRVRHGQWEFFMGMLPSQPLGPIQIVQSNYSTISAGRAYFPREGKLEDGRKAFRYSDGRIHVPNASDAQTLLRLTPKDRTISARQRRIATRIARRVKV